jgi:hypothetical protein
VLYDTFATHFAGYHAASLRTTAAVIGRFANAIEAAVEDAARGVRPEHCVAWRSVRRPPAAPHEYASIWRARLAIVAPERVLACARLVRGALTDVSVEPRTVRRLLHGNDVHHSDCEEPAFALADHEVVEQDVEVRGR